MKNGEVLIELFMANTHSKHPARHITTRQGQRRDKNSQSIVKIFKQIDYILLLPQWLRTNMTDARSYNGTLKHLTTDRNHL